MAGSYPTIVPQNDITQDSLNQFDQAAQQGQLDAFDAAAQAGQDQLAATPPPPDHSLSPDDPATSATAKAVSVGADPGDLANARQQMGSQAYRNLCEQFVENMSGKTGQFSSAINAWNAQGDRQQQDMSQIRPGDLVYYGPAGENGGYGHAAIYSGNGKVVSATSGGVKETPARGYFGAPMLGYIPAGDNQQLAPSPMTAPQGGPNYQPPSQTAPSGETYGHLARPMSTEDSLSLFDRAAQDGQDTLDQITSSVGNAASGLGSAAQGLMSKITGIQPDQPVGPDNQGNLALSPDQQTALTEPVTDKGPGDVATVMQTAAQPLEAAQNAVNPKNIGNAAAQAVLSAEGKTMKPEPSFPVITGASDLAASLTAPGGVLPKAGELAAGAEAAPSLADALRAAADHLDRKGIGLVGPGAGETLPGDVVAGSGINPAPAVQAAGDALGGAKYEMNRLLAPAKNTPPEVQQALADFANVASPGMGADVQAESLARKVQDVLGPDDNLNAAINFERTGEFVPNPTLEQAAVAQDVRDFTQQTGDAGRLAGFISGDVTAGGGQGPSQYLMHLYDDTAQQAAQAGSRGLNPKDVYSFQRQYPTLEDAVAAGKTPVDSVAQPIQAYAGKVLDSQAKVDLVNNLKALPDPPVMDMPPVGKSLPDGFVPGAAIAPQFQGVAFTKPVADALNNVLGTSAMRNAPVLGGAVTAMGAAKENLFSLSGFHLGTELRQAYRAGGPVAGTQVAARSIWNAVNPFSYDAFRLANADAFDKWAQQGVTGLAGRQAGPDVGPVAGALIKGAVSGAEGAALGAGVANQAGMSDQDRLKAALIGGAAGAVLGPTLGTQFSKALWERAVPTLKVSTAELLGQKYAPDAVATFVNQTYGGQNLAAIARSKTVQDVLRVGVLSPDWWEGWARQIGSAVLPNDLGKMSRGYWLRTATIDGAFGLEGLNKAINGHFTNDNESGREFDLEITGLVGKDAMGNRQYLDILGPLKSIVQLASSPVMPGSGGVGQFASSRIGLAPSLGLAAVTNQDYAKQPIVPPGTPPQEAGPEFLDAAMQRLAPIGGQQVSQMLTRTTTSPDLPQGPAPGATAGETAGTILTGMRTSAGPAPSVLYNQRDEGLAKLQSQSQNRQFFQAYKQAGRPLDQPQGSYKGVMFKPDEQLAFQQARLSTLSSMFKPGEWQKVMAMPPGDRNIVLGKLLDAADKVAAAQVLSKVGNAGVNQRLAAGEALGRQGARAEAMREPPMFTAPKAA